MNHIVSSSPKARILLVDDEPKVLRALNAALDIEFEVHTSDSAVNAKTLIKNEGPFDVIVSDQVMPGVKGHEFLNWCAKNAPKSKRMMLTGLPISDELRLDLVDVEKVEIFSKPWNIETIKQSLHSVSASSKTAKEPQIGKNTSTQPILIVEPSAQCKTIYSKLSEKLNKQLYVDSVNDLILYQDKYDGVQLVILCMDDELTKRFDIIEMLHRRYPKTQFILTAEPKIAREITHLEKNFERINILVKPFSLTRLIDKIKKTTSIPVNLLH